MEIPHPRRILAVSKSDACLVDLLQGLTNSAPPQVTDSVAGLTHPFRIETAYYTATVPIWLDVISSPTSWSSDFLLPEAKEVLSALGAFIVCFQKPTTQSDLDEVKSLLDKVGVVVREGCGYGWDGVCLAVGLKQSVTPFLDVSEETWEDLCQQSGFEWIDFEKKGRNEFSETMGVERLKEALEANDWGGGDDLGDELDLDDLGSDGGDDDEGGSLDFGIDREEMKEDMAGMKRAIYGGGLEDEDEIGEETAQDAEVEKLQAMMLKMQAVRDMGADMPEAERKKFAAKAVNDIMKTL